MTVETDNHKDLQRILEERARILAKTDEGDSLEQHVFRVLAFSVGEEHFGLDLNYIQEIQPLKPELWTLVPCTPDFIVGAVNIRGRLYSIMNIAAYLEIGVKIRMEKAHVLLIRGETGPEGTPMEFCILAEDRPKLEQLTADQLQPATGTLSAKGQVFIRGVTADMLMVLDLEKLISHPGIVVDEETV